MFNRIRDQLTMGVFAGAILIMVSFLAVLWLVLFLFRPTGETHLASTAIFTVIPPVFTTPVPQSDDINSVAEATEEISQNEIMVGNYVEVFDTGSAGLRIRSAAGVNNFVQFIAFDAELYQIQAGPQDADGYRWWFIVSAYDDDHSGWAVENYLKVITIQ